MNELKKHATSLEYKELSVIAQKRLKLIQEELIPNGIVQLEGNKNDRFADRVFLSVFSYARVDTDLVLITQDKDLAEDILGLNDSQSIQSNYDVDAYLIDDDGNLEYHNENYNYEPEITYNSSGVNVNIPGVVTVNVINNYVSNDEDDDDDESNKYFCDGFFINPGGFA